MYRCLKSYQRTDELSTVSALANQQIARFNQACPMDPKRLIQNNYLVVIAFLLITVAWLEEPPIAASAQPKNPAPVTLDSQQTDWALPVSEPVQLMNGFRQPNSDYSAGHRGVDLAVDFGQPVTAPAAGVVHFLGTVVNREVLTLEHIGGLLTSFEPVCSDLNTGDQVAQGQVIGWVCEADDSYRNHCTNRVCLHFSLRLNASYLSPLAAITDKNPSRLMVRN